MRILCRFIVALLIANMTVQLTNSLPVYGQEQITRITPTIRLSTQEEIPVKTETKVSNWTWWALAIVAVAGGAAVAGGGGGKSSSSSQSNGNNSPATNGSGEAVVRW